MHEGSIIQLRHRLDELADDVGRLRKRLDPETCTFSYLGDRIAGHVEALCSFIEPTAAELAAYACGAAHLEWEGADLNGYNSPPVLPGDNETIDEAIRIVDARYRSLQHRLRGHA